jgi:predicted metal-dependent enzyme (double-stranded beta helix superfamily)
MYGFQDLLDELRHGAAHNDFGALQAAVARAVAGPPFPADTGKTQILYNGPGLMVLHALIGGNYISPPHDHRTWAVIGVYAGQEDNTFYRLVGDYRRLEPNGARSLRERDVLMLDPNMIHSITNPRVDALMELHIYGLNIFEIERSAWDPVTGMERPFEVKIGRHSAIGGLAQK